MRLAYITLASIMISAVAIAVGGHFLSHTEVKQITSINRLLLEESAEKFKIEVHRLDQLYLQHLANLSIGFGYLPQENFEASASDLTGVKAYALFREGKLIQKENFSGPTDLHFEYITKEKFTPHQKTTPIRVHSQMATHALQKIENSNFLLYVKNLPDHATLAILVDQEEVYNKTSLHLTQEMHIALKPLKQNKEYVRLHNENNLILLTTGKHQDTSETVSMPIYSTFGFWTLNGWDKMETTSVYNQQTLITAYSLGGILALIGILLFRLLAREARLAEQRVSFVNNVSHELSTPLTNIALNLSLVKDSPLISDQRILRKIQLANEETERLSRIVKNVLTFASSKKKKSSLNHEKILPDQLIAQTHQTFIPALKRANIESHLDLNIIKEVSLDADTFCQIIANLISNVEKHAASGKLLSITSRIVSEHIHIKVQDRGDGIPKKFQKQIFQPFKRIENKTNHGASGTGLGLNIVHTLTHNMQGEIKLIESEHGACFLLILPIQPADLK